MVTLSEEIQQKLKLVAEYEGSQAFNQALRDAQKFERELMRIERATENLVSGIISTLFSSQGVRMMREMNDAADEFAIQLGAVNNMLEHTSRQGKFAKEELLELADSLGRSLIIPSSEVMKATRLWLQMGITAKEQIAQLAPLTQSYQVAAKTTFEDAAGAIGRLALQPSSVIGTLRRLKLGVKDTEVATLQMYAAWGEAGRIPAFKLALEILERGLGDLGKVQREVKKESMEWAKWMTELSEGMGKNFAPSINQADRFMVDLLKTVADVTPSVMKLNSALFALGTAVAAVGAISAGGKLAKQTLLWLGAGKYTGLIGLTAQIGIAIAVLGGFNTALLALGRTAEERAKTFDDLQKKFKELSGIDFPFASWLKQIDKEMPELIKKLTEVGDELLKNFREMGKALGLIDETVQAIVSPDTVSTAAWDPITHMFEGWKSTLDLITAALRYVRTGNAFEPIPEPALPQFREGAAGQQQKRSLLDLLKGRGDIGGPEVPGPPMRFPSITLKQVEDALFGSRRMFGLGTPENGINFYDPRSPWSTWNPDTPTRGGGGGGFMQRLFPPSRSGSFRTGQGPMQGLTEFSAQARQAAKETREFTQALDQAGNHLNQAGGGGSGPFGGGGGGFSPELGTSFGGAGGGFGGPPMDTAFPAGAGGGGGGGGGGGSAGKWWTPDRVQQGVNYLTQNAGIPLIAAQALVARWAGVEAGGGPGSVNPRSGAVGIAQWLGPRKRAGVPGDYEGQLAKVVSELKGPEKRAYQMLLAAKTPEEAAIAAAQFERAEGYNRSTGADAFVGKTLGTMNQLFGGQNVGTPGSNIPGRTQGLQGGFMERLNSMYSNAPDWVRNGLSVGSGWRSWAEQARLYAQKPGLAAPPGRSKHQLGLAGDLKFANPAIRAWVHANAARYGLRFPMSYEPWHIEPIRNWQGQLPAGAQNIPMPTSMPAGYRAFLGAGQGANVPPPSGMEWGGPPSEAPAAAANVPTPMQVKDSRYFGMRDRHDIWQDLPGTLDTPGSAKATWWDEVRQNNRSRAAFNGERIAERQGLGNFSNDWRDSIASEVAQVLKDKQSVSLEGSGRVDININAPPGTVGATSAASEGHLGVNLARPTNTQIWRPGDPSMPGQQ